MNRIIPNVAFLSLKIDKLKKHYYTSSKLRMVVVFDHLIKQDSTKKDLLSFLRPVSLIVFCFFSKIIADSDLNPPGGFRVVSVSLLK